MFGPKFMHGAAYTGATFAASGGPWYLPLSGNFPGAGGVAGQVGFALESSAQITIQHTCFISDLNIVPGTLGASTTANVRLRKNGGYATVAAPLTASNTGVHDTTHSDLLVPGDKVCWEVTVTGANTVPFAALSFLEQPLVFQNQLPSWFTILPSDNPPPSIGAGVTAYGSLFGTGTTGGITEGPWQVTARDLMWFGFSEGNILTNSLNVSYSSIIRKNTANGRAQLVIPAGTTGRLIDRRYEEYYPGDVYDFSAVVPAGTGTLSASIGNFHGYGRTRDYLIYMRSVAGVSLVFNKNQTMPIEGEAHAANLFSVAAAALGAQAPLVPHVFNHLRVTPLTNTFNGVTTLTFMVSGVDSALTVSIPAGSTTIQEDQTHSVTTVAADYCNQHVDTRASSSGAMTFHATVAGRPVLNPLPW